MDRIQQLRRMEWNWPLGRRVAETLLSYDADYRKLSIEARGSVVILTGYVVDEESQTIAREVTQSVRGVAEVIDRIAVRRRRKAPKLTALDVPVTTALDSPTVTGEESPRRLWLTPVALVALLVVIGGWQWLPLPSFSSSLPDNYYIVEGTAFVGGQPAVGAELTFYPLSSTESLQSRPKAIVGPDGRYTIETPGEGAGAPAGRYVVTARTTQPGANATAAVPAHYADPRTTPLSVEITPGDVVNLPSFDLAQASVPRGKPY